MKKLLRAAGRTRFSREGCFLVLAATLRLDMSLADGIKFIMSLGSVSPAYPAQEKALSATATADSNGSGVPKNSEAVAPVEPEDLTRFEGEGCPELLSLPLRTWQGHSRPAGLCKS